MTTAQLNVKNAFVIDHVDPEDKELSELKNLSGMKLDTRAKKKALKRKEFDATYPGIARMRAKLLEGKYAEEYINKKEPAKEEDPAMEEVKEEPKEEPKPEEVKEEPKPEVVQPSRVGIGAKW